VTCGDCGAVEYGNLTCRTCRRYMRENDHCPAELLDLLDAANGPTVPPVGVGEIRAFLARLE
jgi:hypothetical protein